jgi:hypothetical protein
MPKAKKTNENKILKFGVLSGLGEFAYIFLVITVMDYFSRKMGQVPDEKGVLAPLFFLTTFVFSVAISGLIVFGYPVYLLTQKKIKGAALTIFTTLAAFLIILLLIATLVLLFKM